MTEQIYKNPDIYKIYVPLPNNPLKNLNCYVIKTKDKNLIIDTGFNIEECYNALKEGLHELEIDMEKMGLTEQEMIKIIRNGFAYGIDGKKYLPMFDAWVKDFYERPENKECEE